MLSEVKRDDAIFDDPPPPSLLRVMLSRLCPSSKELFVVFIVTIAITSILGGTRLKTRKARDPEPFFESQLVHDYPQGNLDEAFKVASKSVFALICYYAPWDSESQEIRREYETVAELLSEKVSFLAVNCWNPESSCRDRFNKIPYYPIVVMHVRGYKGVVYKGPLKASYMARFVMEATKRVLRIDAVEEVTDLLHKKDVVVLGHFDIKGPAHDPRLPKAFHLFYSAALKALERDFAGDVGFGVVVNPVVAEALGLKEHGIAVHTWLHYEVYPGFRNLSAATEVPKLLDWVFETALRSVEWVTLKGAAPFRGQGLSKFVSSGPTMVLFADRNPWVPVSPLYSLLLQLSAEYLNCEGLTGISDFVENLADFRKKIVSQHALIGQQCEARSVFVSEVKPNSDNICSASDKGAVEPAPSSSAYCRCGVENSSLVASIGVLFNRDAINSKSNRWTRTTTLGAPRRVGMPDDRVTAAMDYETVIECRLHALAAAALEPLDVVMSVESTAAVRGLRCDKTRWHDEDTPRALSFVAVDRKLHGEFAARFGVTGNESFAVIIDAGEESHYVLRGPVTEKKLVELVVNFTRGAVTRSKFKGSSVGEQTLSCDEGDKTAGVCVGVEELDSDNFDDVINGRQQDLVLLFYTPWCGFCSTASHIFLEVSKLFSDFRDDVRFLRVDGDANTLPWEYDMPAFPTVLYLPADRHKDGMVFPHNVPLDSEGLLKFVMANAPVRLRWKFALADCDAECLSQVRVGVRARINGLLGKHRAGLRRGEKSRSWRRGIFAALQRYQAMYWAFTDPSSVYRVSVL